MEKAVVVVVVVGANRSAINAAAAAAAVHYRPRPATTCGDSRVEVAVMIIMKQMMVMPLFQRTSLLLGQREQCQPPKAGMRRLSCTIVVTDRPSENDEEEEEEEQVIRKLLELNPGRTRLAIPVDRVSVMRFAKPSCGQASLIDAAATTTKSFDPKGVAAVAVAAVVVPTNQRFHSRPPLTVAVVQPLLRSVTTAQRQEQERPVLLLVVVDSDIDYDDDCATDHRP